MKEQWKPWIVNREAFLRECFSCHAGKEQMARIIESSPLDAGMDHRYITEMANEMIHFHMLRAGVSSVSASLANGILRFLTIPIEYVSFVYEAMLLTQKLLYLYTNMKQDALLKHHQLQGYLAIFFGASITLKGSSVVISETTRAVLRYFISKRLAPCIALTTAAVNASLCSVEMYQMAKEFIRNIEKRRMEHQQYLTIGYEERCNIDTPLFTVE